MEIVVDIYVFAMALTLAILEIQIEGENGWAKNLPTWRPNKPSVFSRTYSSLMSGKPLTGYHLAVFSFVVLVFHLPFIFGFPLTVNNWLKIISLLFIYLVVWDFLWFVLNPNFILNRFNPKNVTWHLRWIGPVPKDYVKALAASFLSIVLATYLGPEVITWWLRTVFVFLTLVLLTIFISKFVVKKRVD